jgi:uncharacterized protein with HEPN domain
VPRRDWTIRLEDTLDAGEKVVLYTHGLHDLGAFAANEMAVDAVIRNVQVIGEAARHIPDDIRARYSDIAWVGMHGMRNILVHNYGTVRLDVVWGVVQTRISPLLSRLREILDQERLSETDTPI